MPNASAAEIAVCEPDPKAMCLLSELRGPDTSKVEVAVERLAALADLRGRKLDLDFVHETLTEAAREPKVDIESVQMEVAKHFGFDVTDLWGRRRFQEVARARMVAVYLCRKMSEASYPVLGAHFGGRDHTTMMHSFRRIEQVMQDDPGFAREVEGIQARILGVSSDGY